MPRSKFGVKRAHVNEKALKEALEDVVCNKETIGQAAKTHNISKTTLFRHLKLYRDSGSETFSYHSNIAHKKILTTEEELSLAEYLATAAKLHYGLSKYDTKKLAFRFAKANGKNLPESWIKSEAAGKDWMIGFLRRHPALSLRKPEATSISRSTSFNRSNVMSFFNNLKDCLSRYKFDPSRIYNLDETGNSTVHVPPKVIAAKGEKQIGSMTSGERGINVTMIAAISAIGNHVPPMLIFPRVHFKAHMLNNAPPGCIGGANQSGWSNEELFIQFLKHFISHSKPTPDQKVLLIMDNHDTHISLPAINLARQHAVVLLTLPPHTSHKMQPLDRTVFGPYKTYYNKAASEWMLNNAGKPMTLYNIAEIVGNAYPKAFNQQNIVKGFEVTGICPFNEDIFKDDEFLSSYVTDRPCPETPIGCGNLTSADNQLISADDQTQAPSTSQVAASSTFISPEHIRPFPKAAPRKQTITRGKKKGRTRILTDTPEKEEVMASCSKKFVKKRNASKKKVLQESSDDDETIELPMIPRTPKHRQVKDVKKTGD